MNPDYKNLNDDKLLIVGSLNWNLSDRKLTRADICTVQLLSSNGLESVPFFDAWGDLGVSSFAVDPENRFRWFVSTGTDMKEIDLSSGKIAPHRIDHLNDVHEIDFLDEHLWISNTGRNEVLVYDVNGCRMVDRVLLNDHGISGYRNLASEEGEINHYHINQIFNDLSGRPCVLVHTTNGKQFLKRVAGKIVKSQGAGGVISLRSKKRKHLNLKAPHNVRIVRGAYWVCNSGHRMVNIFDRDWRKTEGFPTKGFGRGVSISRKREVIYVGISKTRKRYLRVFPDSAEVPNMIQAFNIDDKRVAFEFLIPNVEQISNIYALDDQQFERFRGLHRAN